MKDALKILIIISSFILANNLKPGFQIEENTLSFELEDREYTYQNEYLKLLKDNEQSTHDVGFPELPTYSTLYMVSPDKDYSFEIIIHDSYLIEDVEIYPYQGIRKEANSLLIDEQFYNSTTEYPENNIIASERMRARNMEVISLSVTPYSYNPQTRNLEVFTNIEIIVNESESTISFPKYSSICFPTGSLNPPGSTNSLPPTPPASRRNPWTLVRSK